MMDEFNIYIKNTSIVFIALMVHSADAMTISGAPDLNIQTTEYPLINTTMFEAIGENANLSTHTINSALAFKNVVIRDNSSLDINILANSDILWSSANNLIIDAPRNIIVENFALITSYGYGNVILRADFAANNNGTVIPPSINQPIVNMIAGGSVKIYYHPADYRTPTNFAPYVKVVSPGFMRSYMAVNDLVDLQKINQNLSGNYALATNIDATNSNHSPIGHYDNPFTGRFDGQGYHIKNLRVALPSTDYAGLFGGSRNATFENVILDNVSIAGRDYVGGLTGYGYGATITDCSVSGDVWGRNSVGGLVGYASYGAKINRVYTEGSVNPTGSDSGGIVGFGTQQVVGIYDSYSFEKINNIEGTATDLGGLAGYNLNVETKNSYAAGPVANSVYSGGLLGYAGSSTSYQNTFWDIEKTTQGKVAGNNATFPGAIGLTTDKMKQRSTFQNAGWDFNFTWGIHEGTSSPYLLWRNIPAPYTFMPSDGVPVSILVLG